MPSERAYMGRRLLSRRSFLGLTAAAGTTALLAACSPSGPATTTTTTAPAKPTGPTGKIVAVQANDVTTLDPNNDTIIHHRNVALSVFDTLVDRDPQMKLRPSLATSWDLVDSNTWRFKLRQNVAFHDGSPFIADDVKYTIDWILDPANKSLQVNFVDTIKEVRVVDPSTVEIVTKQPNPILLNRLTGVPIVSKSVIAKVGRPQFAANPVGTGPFRFVEWKKDQYVTLEANDKHWRGAPKAKTLVYRGIPEASTRIAELETGAADVVVGVPVARAVALSADANWRVGAVGSVRVTHVGFRTTKKPFDNKNVRQAMNYAVDADTLIKGVLRGYGTRVNGLFAPEAFGYTPSIQPYTYDPAKAKQLLAAAGFPDGLDVTIETRSGQDQEATEAIAGQLSKVGVRAKVLVTDYNVFLQKLVEKKQAEMYFFSWGSATFDADGTLFGVLRTGQAYSNYSNPAVDKLLDEGRATLDQKRRTAIYDEANALIKEDAPVVFLYQQKDLYGIRKGVGWEPRPDEMLWFYDATPAAQ